MASERSPLLLHDVAGAANGRTTHATNVNGAYATSVSIAVDGDGRADALDAGALYMGHDTRALLATPSCGLSSLEAARRLKTFGANDPSRAASLSRVQLLLRLALRPKATLVWMAFVLELFQGHVTSAVALLVYQLVTSLVAWSCHARTARALAALDAAVRVEAVVVRDGVHQTINASLLVPGDRLTLAAGVVVPADCQLCSPTVPLLVDPSRLTGASLPVTLSGADSVKQGSTVLAGEGEAIVVATGAQTFGADSAFLLDGAETLDVDKVVVRLTAALAVLAASVLLLGVAVQLFERDRVLRVASYTLVVAAVVVPLSMPAMAKLVVVLGAHRLLLDHKIISTRLAAIEKLARMDVLCCDKTGTLTRDKLELQDELPIFDPRGTREDVLVSAALAAKWKEPPRDAVDTLVLNAIDLRPLDQYVLLHHTPFNGTSKRTESVIRGPTGRVFKVTKGAPESLLALAHNVDEVRDAVEAKVMDLARRGVSSLAVARTEEESADGKWVFLGVITYVDPPRHDSKRMIETAHDCGLAIKLTTGDQTAIAVEACRQLGMGMTVLGADVVVASAAATQATQTTDMARLVEAADGYAHVVPHHKVQIAQHLRQRGWACGVTGADVADVAAMEAAHLAVAVDGASDAACLAADVVLAKPGLSIIVNGVLGARGIFQRVVSYVTFQTLSSVHWFVWVTVSMLLLRPDACHFPHFVPHDAHCGEVEMPSDNGSPAVAANDVERVDAFFRVPIVALVVIGLIQELASIALLHDKIVASKQPQQWQIARLVVDAVCVGVTAAVSTVVLVFWGLDGWNVDGVLSAYNVGSLSIHQVSTFVFLQVALAATLSLFIVRADRHPFASPPSPMLAVVAVLNTALATVLALFSPFADLAPISVKQVAFVWVYSLLWLLVQVVVKTLATIALAEMSHLGAVDGIAYTNRFVRTEAQRRNRMRLGLAFWSDESTVRDSFVLGRAVRSTPSVVHTQDHASNTYRRLSDLEAAVQALQHIASSSALSRVKKP